MKKKCKIDTMNDINCIVHVSNRVFFANLGPECPGLFFFAKMTLLYVLRALKNLIAYQHTGENTLNRLIS